MSISPGSVLAHFRVERELGRGGMGLVYAATDLRLGRRVALKVIRPDAVDPAGREAALHQLEREAQLAAAVSHPNLVTIFTFERQGEQALVAMELLEGQTLADRLKTGWRPSVAEAGWILGEIAAGVAAAHQAGIVHLDLKPGNVMLLSDGRLKVLDFGIARLARQRPDRRSVSQGTPAYMSPEQLVGGALTPAADVWAIGAIGVHLLTGARPYEGPDPQLVAQAVLAGPPAALRVPAAQVFGALEEPLRQCMAPLEHRITDAGALLERLRALQARHSGTATSGAARASLGGVAGRDTSSHSVTSSPQTAPRPGGATLAMLLGTVLVLLAGGAYFVWAGTGSRRATAGGGGGTPQGPVVSQPDHLQLVADTTTAYWDGDVLGAVARGPSDSGEAFLRLVLAELLAAEQAHHRHFSAYAPDIKVSFELVRRRGEAPLFIEPDAGVDLVIRLDQASDGGFVAHARDGSGLECTLRVPPGGASDVSCDAPGQSTLAIPTDSTAGLGFGADRSASDNAAAQ